MQGRPLSEGPPPFSEEKEQHQQRDLTPPREATTAAARNVAIEELKAKLVTKEADSETTAMIPESQKSHAPPLLGEDGLIIPRKPPNPVRENADRQNLHKELRFNQKIGKNVLNQKSELQRALERQKDNIARRELENHVAQKTPELEKVIADRARRLQEGSQDNKNEDDKSISPEFLQARMKLKNRQEGKLS